MKKVLCYVLLTISVVFSIVNTVAIALTWEKSPEQIFENTTKSIVEIKATTEGVGESYGTAEFIGEDGTLVSNAHVVTYKKMGETYAFENISIRFSFENDYRAVALQKYDMDLDVAVLKLVDTNCDFNPLTVGDSTKIANGNKVYAIGNLNNSGLSITTGIVSNSSIEITYDNVTRKVIQCDLTIADGNSGGALLDKNGKLIGITTFRLKDQSGNVIYGISYCIPINTVVEYIEKMEG